MTAEIGQRFTAWTYSDSSCNDHCTQDASVQHIVLDHGSISFGRFATESLSWEKRSVFSHNGRQEELRQLTLPGLVAQKKAFFEEYYKRARTLKAQEVAPQTEVTLDDGSDANTLGQSGKEDQTPAVVSDDLAASAPSFSLEPSAEVCIPDGNKCQDPHELGYLTFNPLFSQATGLQIMQQEEGSTCAQKQDPDGEFASDKHVSSRHGLKHGTLESKVLAPKQGVLTENSGNFAVPRIVLPIASTKSEGFKFNGIDKQEPRKNIGVISGSTTRTKEPSTTLSHFPQVNSRGNSENKTSQDLKDLFHKRVEMKLRALSDKMIADRVATSARSASLTSHKPPKEVQRAATLPREIFFSTGSCGSQVVSSNNNAAGKVAAKSLMMPNLSQVHGKNFGSAQVTAKKAASLAGLSNGSRNKRVPEMVKRQLIAPVASRDDSLKRRYVYVPSASTARSRSDSLLTCRTANAPKTSYRKHSSETKVELKAAYGSHIVGERNVVPVNCNEENRKLVQAASSHACNSSSNKRKTVSSGLSLSKNKPRQEKERPRWR